MRKKIDPRKIEFKLLLRSIIILLFMFILAFRVSGTRDLFSTGTLWLQWGIFSLSFLAVHLVLNAIGFRGSYLILPCIYVLSMFGFVILTRFGTSAIEGLQKYQEFIYLICVLVLVLTFAATRKNHISFFGKNYFIISIISFAAAAILIIAGAGFRGARFGPAMTTPTEIVKITYPLFLAGFLSRRKKLFTRFDYGVPRPPFSSLLILAGVSAMPFGLALYQNDLGMLCLLACCLITVIYAATGNKRYLVLGVLAGLCLAWFIMTYSNHGKNRLLGFWDPWNDPTGKGWQTIHSLSALNEGGLIGTGLGKGHPETIPIVESDFIYAALCEELGFTGSLCVLLFFYLFFQQTLTIMRSQKDSFCYLFACGLISFLIIQTIFNVGGVVRLVPITGMTLPFVSRGGSSLIINYCFAGIFLALSEPRARRKIKK